MNTTLILINSKDRDEGTIPKFSYSFAGYSPRQGFSSFRINKITIPYAFASTVAQTFVLNFGIPLVSVMPYVIDLPAGNYTPTTLVNKLNELTTALLGPDEVLWSFDSLTNKFKVEVINVINRITLDFNTTSLPANEFYKSVGRQMGYFAETFEPQDLAFFQESSFFPNFGLTNNIYIKSQALTNSVSSFFVKKRNWIVQSVLVDVNPNEFINFENQSPILFPNNPNNPIDTIDLELLDDWGYTLDQKLDWSIEIQFFS